MSEAVRTVPVIGLDETNSTNAEAVALAHSGARQPPFWVRAVRQTSGKGRDGRAWESMPGNLHASLAVPLECDLRTAPQLSLVAGVGVIEAVRSLAEGKTVPRLGDLRLKWPNDVMIGTAKCGGILIETTVEPHSNRLVAVIGIGLNIADHPVVAGRGVTDLTAEGFGVCVDDVFARVAATMDAALQVWDFGTGFPLIRLRWLAGAMPLGTALSVHAGAKTDGFFAGLDDDGALLMRDMAGRVQRITFGDVMLQSS